MLHMSYYDTVVTKESGNKELLSYLLYFSFKVSRQDKIFGTVTEGIIYCRTHKLSIGYKQKSLHSTVLFTYSVYTEHTIKEKMDLILTYFIRCIFKNIKTVTWYGYKESLFLIDKETGFRLFRV